MLKVRWRVRESLWLECDATDSKDALQQLGDFMEVFGESHCVACRSQNVMPVHRRAKGFDFYEMKCCDCGSALRFGVKKEDHTLFPKRKDEQGNWLPHNGWVKYQKAEATEPAGEF